ncbi:semaphorin-2A isoform X2 [Brachionus plicatilis]|uniref:Semaphorin-2A isoform X2 n=1 Tax=Brachionus plicatilis TaxID=10195 RepID=A0A3M7Q6Y3_BRAPC|nr:semaphorin-2A isoform X2 [Brachionus plicatilis]
MSCKLIAILLCIHLASGQTVPSFVPNSLKRFSNGTNFTSLLLVDRALYVGARDLLLKLDSADIESNKGLYTSLSLATNSDQKEQCISTYYDEKLCSNFIKFVLHRPSFKDLYVCGSYSFQPRLFQLSYDLNLIKEDDGYGYCSLNPMDSSTAIWIDNGNPMNIPSLYSASYLDASTKTQPVEPVIYRPELRRADKSFHYLRSPKFDSDWLSQPHFLKSFDVDDYVLFFFREKSVEQVAEAQDQNYARVVRVCKSDAGALKLGNLWSSMRKTRLTCVYNNTYLNRLEDIVRVSADLFVGLFSLRLPGQSSVSFLCEFSKESLLNGLNSASNSFKEIMAGTQYWSKVSDNRIPKNFPNQCNYNSQLLKDDVINFVKTHSLIGDHIEGPIIHFVNKHAISVAHERLDLKLVNQAVFPLETLPGTDITVNVFYFGTDDGKIIKMSSYDSQKVIAQWNLETNGIKQLKLKKDKSLFAISDDSVYQVELNLQCSKYYTCGLCMSDPHCGWNIRTNLCESIKSNSNLVNLNTNLCSRLERHENIKSVEVESGSALLLECNVKDQYLFGLIEWKKDQISITTKNQNVFFTWNKDLIILNGNASYNGVYNCYADKHELLSSYNVVYKSDATKSSLEISSSGQKCITAESYIKQYNNWCDEYNRYHRALNDWEEMKDKLFESRQKLMSLNVTNVYIRFKTN